MLSATAATTTATATMVNCRRKRLGLFCIFASAFMAFLTATAKAKPTINFSLTQNFPSLMTLTQQFVERRNFNQMKDYSGRRIRNDSLIMIYFHDQTIAVVELGPDKQLLGCELIEIYKDEDGERILKKLSTMNRPLQITFKEMLKLMNQCDIVDRIESQKRSRKDLAVQTSNDNKYASSYFPRSPLSLLSGIIPGTKWCGTGDIANTYYDLGTESNMDRCCRTHDLCPTKIRAYQHRYELSNDSLYTKSHCNCDDMLYSCLKKVNTSAAQFMGSIYFNLVQVPCLKQDKGHLKYRRAKQF